MTNVRCRKTDWVFVLAAVFFLHTFAVSVQAAAVEEPVDGMAPLLEQGEEQYTVQKGDSLYKIAKQYGTTIELIKRTNRLESDTIYPGMKLKVVEGTFSISVDKSDNILKLYLDSNLVKEYSVATGENNGTPTGDFKVINKLENPTWYHAGAVVPPESPENILGTRWLGIDHPGYGIHGTTLPESIGKQATAGCVRMLNRDVEELYAIVPVGTKVAITD